MRLSATPRTIIVIKQVSEHFIGAMAYFGQNSPTLMDKVGRYNQDEINRFIRRHQLYAVNNLFGFHISDSVPYSMFHGDHLQVGAREDCQDIAQGKSKKLRAKGQKTAISAASKRKPVSGVTAGSRHKKAQATVPGALKP